VGWVYGELVVVSIAAALSPTTLTFSILAVVLAKRPLRTGVLFYIGAFSATIAIGILAAIVLGDTAASTEPSSPKTWVAVLDLVGAGFLLWYAWRLRRHPFGPEKEHAMVEQMQKVASSRWIAVLGAGAALANPGGYIPIALKAISETDPSTTQYALEWLFFTVVALLPLLTAIILMAVSPDWANKVLNGARRWLIRNLTLIAIVIIVVLALSLLRGGISGLTD
jgi:threonine/homoserine/homoserine lactone efflux protein